MNREKDELIPFQAEVNVNLFFPGAQRRELLDEVKKAIVDGVAVLSIIGEEGTGKTMLCRMVEKELSDGFVCVYLPENLESFNEVVRILASEAGVDDTDQSQSVEDTVSAIIDRLKERGQHLVVIFDQAERMYLAMLERLRKLLDRANADENLLQLIFAGRKVLLENLDQLAICDFADAAETHFYLDDLDVSETYAYLNHCARQRSRAKGKSIFTPEASKKIFTIARGNLKTTNILAAKAIEAADDEGSFVVAPRNVNIKDTGLEVMHESFLAGVRRRSGWLMISGALLLLLSVLLIALFTGGDENERTTLQQPERTLEISSGKEQGVEALSSSSDPATELSKTGLREDAISESSINESPIVFKTEAEDQAEQQKNIQLTKENTKSLVPADQIESTAVHNQSGLDDDASSTRTSFSKNNIEKIDSNLQRKEVSGVEIEKQEIESKANHSEPIAVELSQIRKELQQGKDVEPSKTGNRVKVSGLSVQEEVDSTLLPQEKKEVRGVLNTPEHIKKQEKKIIVAVSKQSEQKPQEFSKVLAETKKSVPNHLQSIDAPKQLFKVAQVKLPTSGKAVFEKAQQPSNLYEQRVDAGKALFSGKIEGTQTIQVMALTGEQAEKNLKERFSRQQYQEVANNLYILESSNSSTLFVFYGAYPDRESANRAKEQLPEFLSKNEPYVISILEAQSKITPQQ